MLPVVLVTHNLLKKKKTLVIQKEMKKVKFIIVLLPKGNM